MKDVKDYEGLYAITSCGRVWSYKRQAFLTPTQNTNGYWKVQLSKNGKTKNFLVHRLVAEAYIPNPDNLPIVNHMNENINTNHINNLEWCTYKYNSNYGTHLQKIRKKVKCVELNKVFDSMTEAAKELGLANCSHISGCCRGERKTCGGYHWKYYEGEDE